MPSDPPVQPADTAPPDEHVVARLVSDLRRLALNGATTVTWGELDDLLRPFKPTSPTSTYALTLEGRALLDPIPTPPRQTGKSFTDSLYNNMFAGRVSRWRILPAVLVPPPPDEPPPAPVRGPITSGPLHPRWDADTRTLMFGGWRHSYGRRAPSQERVLAAFEKAGWPERVTASLPQNLSGVVRNLKRSLGEDCPLAFEMDGTSEGVRWSLRGSSTEVA